MDIEDWTHQGDVEVESVGKSEWFSLPTTLSSYMHHNFNPTPNISHSYIMLTSSLFDALYFRVFKCAKKISKDH